MTRVLAALIVIAACTVFTLAEEEKPPVRFPFGPAQTSLPFEVIQQDGKTAWKVTGKGSLRIEDLIGGLASARNLRVTFSQQAAGRVKENVPYVGPDSGIVVPNAELADYASELMASAGLTIVGASTGKARVVKTDEAPAIALYVNEIELPELPASEWVTVRGTLRLASIDTVIVLAQSRARGEGGLTVRTESSNFVLTGPAGQVLVMLRMIRESDSASAGSDGKLVRVYELHESVKAADAVLVIRALFDEGGQSIHNVEKNIVIQANRGNAVNVAVLPPKNRIVVRASTSDHALVALAVNGMK
ncbi:MAG: hypothetical protein KF754_05440 [Planctomycetes bacterium]|nr:hypothetical protein [Planctomycetota bacterium]